MAHVLQSTRFRERGVRHGFSLRTGGVSVAPFESANMATHVGDAPHAVAENKRRFAASVGFDLARLHEVDQVHGARVIVVDGSLSPEALRREQADALVSAVPGVALGVRVADCVAVLLASDDGRAVAAVHAGWRGTAGNIVGAAVAALSGLGYAPGTLHALVCPHIAVGAFEVGHEVVEAVTRALPGVHGLVQTGRPKPHVDLTRAIFAQLAAAGLEAVRIEQLAGCTHAEPARFFSFRRDGKASGRHLAAIVAGC